MKILICFFLAIISILVFVRCRSSVDTIRFKPYKSKDYITKEIKVYEAKEWLYPILDSIILKTEECPMYQGLKTKMAFRCGIYSDSITSFGIVSVYMPKYINHAEWTDAIFCYKGYDFFYGGYFLETFFEMTDKTMSITCVDPKKYQYDIHDMGDSEMEWHYEFRNGHLKNIVYGYCSEDSGGLILNK